jgi:hypothetical protein
MFTIIPFAAVGVILWTEPRRQRFDSEVADENIKQTRQDLRLIVYLLFAVVVMLGIIADRVH